MKLADYLSLRLTGLFIIIFLIWSVVYFSTQMYEIYDGVDEGLTNLKQEFVMEANKNAYFVENMEKYNPINMIVEEIAEDEAQNIKEEYSTTTFYFETEKEFEEVRMLTTAFKCQPNGKYYYIKIFTSTVETEDLIENMLFLLIGLWLTLGILILWASRYIIRRSSNPFDELLDKLHNFSLNRTQMIDFPKTNITEFRALNHAVEVLLKENIQTYKDQKIFIENTSHELQTPLTIVINKIELLMSSEEIPKHQLIELNGILSNLNRMKRLNSSLLLLSKINNRQFIANQEVNLMDTLNEVLENFEDLIEHKNISLDINIQEAPIFEMNVDLAHIMISNLVKNAINYNISGGRINIALNKNSFIIANDGNALPNGINIFERYKSGKEMNSSTGLGLAIVSSIVSIYKFRIEYTYKEMHTISVYFN